MKHLRILILSLTLFALPFLHSRTWAQDTSWYSDSETVFTLTSKDQFLGFRDLVNSGKTFEGKAVKLETDIVLNDFSELSLNSESLMEWIPIGNSNNPFKGTFDGNGNTIYGMYINSPYRSYAGLFGYLQKGTIQNLCIENSYICAYKYIGGIVGKCSQGTIDNCKNKSSITINYDYGGGICGQIEEGTISKCCNYGDIVCSSSYGQVGGIVGGACASNIYNCANYAIIEVENGTLGSSRTGGIVGWFTGDGSYHYLSNCYNKGSIHGKVTCGGIVGYASGEYKSMVYHSINYGTVSVYYNNGQVGAIIASNYNNRSTIGGCYYLDTSCVMDERNTSGTSRTDSQLKSQDFLDQFNSSIEKFANASGLSYDTWKFGKDGYPILYFINEDEPEFIEIKSLVLPEIVTAKVNLSTTIELTCFPFFAKKDLHWESANEQVATIDQYGNVTGIAPGITTITVTDNLANVQATCTVSVTMEVGDTFNADMSNGVGSVSTTFMLTDFENRYVSLGDGTNAAIATATTGSIVIPETIVGPGNLTYTITSIGSKAFYSSNITAVSIPQNITAIGDNAFNGCSNLTSVTVESTEPLTINSNCFSIKAGATLYVPKGCYEVYKKADVWKSFGTILEPLHSNSDLFTASITAGGKATDASFIVIDATNKFVSLGNGQEATIDDLTEGAVVIPSTVKGYDGQTYQVKEISDVAFFDCYGITSIQLPSDITAIGRLAFYDCAGLTAFTIPSTVTSIGEEAFNNCYNLTSISIPANVTSIGDAAFYSCSKLTSVTVNSIEPVAIDNECFTNSVNATLNLPKGSYENYSTADNWKNFKTIKEPAHSVGDTFKASVAVGGSNYKVIFRVTNTSSHYVSIGDGEETAFPNSATGRATIPYSITGYDGISYDVTAISDKLFYGCNRISSIIIPYSVKEIGSLAFGDCTNLSSLEIPKFTTTIANTAFSGCDNLVSVQKKGFEPISIDTGCFPNAENAVLYVSFGAKENYENAEGWKNFKDIIELKAEDGDIFTDETQEGVKMTFQIIKTYNQTCKVGYSLNSLAVYKDTKGQITIPSTTHGYNVTEINQRAFKDCTNLTSVTIPNSITNIGEYAFYGCNGLTSITIPNSVTSIGNSAFSNCYKISTVVVNWETPIAYPNWCFTNANKKALLVPIGKIDVYKAASGWKNFGEIANGMENALAINDTIGRRGGKVVIPILMNNEEDISSVSFKLVLPSGFTLTECALSSRKGDHIVYPEPQSDGSYLVTAFSINNQKFQGNDGPVMNLIIDIDGNVEPDDYLITIKEIELSTEDYPIYPVNYSTTLTVDDFLVGDANGNGEVTPFDAVLAIRYYLGRNPSPFWPKAANVSGDKKDNGDENITPFDAVSIIRIYLNNIKEKNKARKLTNVEVEKEPQ